MASSGLRMKILCLIIMADSVWKWIRRLGGPGLILLGLADSAPFISAPPGSEDLFLIVLSGRHHESWAYYALMATVGVFGLIRRPPTPGQRFYRALSVAAPADTNLVFIQPGTFTMGSPTNEVGRYSDETQDTVTISRGFWMGQFLVTQGDYLAVVGSGLHSGQANFDGQYEYDASVCAINTPSGISSSG